MARQGMGELRTDMEVYTSDAVHVGRVKEIRGGDVLIDRSQQRDIYVPLQLVGQVLPEEGRVELEISDDMLQNTEWEHPPIF